MLNRSDNQTTIEQGKRFREEKNYEKALKFSELVLGEDPGNVDALMLKANTLCDLGKFHEAKIIIYDLYKNKSHFDRDKQVSICCLMGRVHFLDRRYGSANPGIAKEFYLEALRMAPDDGTIMIDLIYVYLAEQRFLQALDMLQDCLELCAKEHQEMPSTINQKLQSQLPSGIYHEHAEITKNYGEYKKVLEKIEQKGLLNPEDVSVLRQRAKRLIDMSPIEREDDIVSIYNQLMNLNPNDVEALEALGDVYRRKQEWLEASLYYGEARAILPDKQEISGKFNHAIEELGRQREMAAKALAKAMKITPERWEKIIQNMAVLTVAAPHVEVKESAIDAEIKNKFHEKMNQLRSCTSPDPRLILSFVIEFLDENDKKMSAPIRDNIISKIRQIPELVCLMSAYFSNKKSHETLSKISGSDQLIKLLNEMCPPQIIMENFKIGRDQSADTVPQKICNDLFDIAYRYVDKKNHSISKGGIERGHRLMRKLGHLIANPDLTMESLVNTLSNFIKNNPGSSSLYTEIEKNLSHSAELMTYLKQRVGEGKGNVIDRLARLPDEAPKIKAPPQADTSAYLARQQNQPKPEPSNFFKPESLYVGPDSDSSVSVNSAQKKGKRV